MDFTVVDKCGLLVWFVRAQHVHYHSNCERESGGMFCHSIMKAKSRTKSPDLHLISVRMVPMYLCIRMYIRRVGCLKLVCDYDSNSIQCFVREETAYVQLHSLVTMTRCGGCFFLGGEGVVLLR